VVIAVAVLLLSLALPPAADYLMRPGSSALSVTPDALAITATLQCAPPASPATELRATAKWRWTQHELLPHGTDALAFRWQVTDPATGDPLAPYLVQLTDAPGTGVSITDQGRANPGPDGSPGPFWLGPEGPDSTEDVVPALMSALGASDDFAHAATRQHHEGLAETVMIRVDRQQLRDGSFLMVLGPDPNAYGQVHGEVTIDVGYVHAGRWIVWSEPVSCSL
jgi:hypothetical protein